MRTDEGRYQIEAELGRGAMGAVYQALDVGTGRRVAIKRTIASGDPQQIERFRREAEVLASLQHPGILKVHSMGTLQGEPYLACELISEARCRAFFET